MTTNKKNFFLRPIPLWAFIAVLLIITGASAFFILAFGTQAFNYTVKISQNGNVDIANFTYGAHPELQNAAFFQQVRDEFIQQKASFIEADLSAMQLRLYEKGEVIYDVPILTKGREGSWWETPAGLYKAQGKEKNHFSSFGSVYMPYSVPFQGNFFIHGWPYHPDGTDVESNFSGGCIRLSTEDAGKIYDAISVGTPILVHEADFASDSFTYQGKQPATTASHILVADLKSNFVIMQKDSATAVPIASITKLVTALIATEYINIEKKITVPSAALVYTSKPRLKTGQQISVYSLLYPMLEESSNEAAETLTRYLGTSYFVSLMNQKIASLGMKNSHMADGSGVSPENISTAEDLFNLAKYLHNNRGFILGVTAGKIERPDLYGYPLYRDLDNFNIFTKDPSFIGGKIGKTPEAKQTYMGIFELSVQGEKRPIAIILLGSDNVTLDAQKILTHVKNTYADTVPTTL